MHNVLKRAIIVATFAASVFFSAQAFAMDMTSVMVGQIELTNAFTRAMPPNAPSGGGWVTITNHGDMADRLVAVTSSRAKSVQVHNMTMDANNVMVMREMPDGVEIPPGATVELSPGGMHLMFMGIDQAFKQGETVPVTLNFETAGEVTIDLPVAALGATEMPMQTDMHMH